MMLIHKDETHKCALRTFLYLIYSKEGLTTYFLKKKIFEQSRKIRTFRNVLQCPTVFHTGMFYKVLQYYVEHSSTFEKVPDYYFSF